MGWEQQGRQYHAWFGHGTGDQGDQTSGPPTPAQAVAAVLQKTAEALPPRRRASFEEYLSRRGAVDLGAAVPVWASVAALEPPAFRALLGGAPLTQGAAAALQAAGRAFATDTGPASVAAAAGHIADALMGDVGQDWLYRFVGAVDQTVYLAANDLLPPEPRPAPPAAPPMVVLGSAVAGSPAATVIRTVGPPLARTVARFGFPGVVAAVIIGGVVYWLGDADDPGDPVAEAEKRQRETMNNEARTPKPSGRKDEPIGTDSKPPPGSKPISETPWSGDHGIIKGHIQSDGPDSVVIAPNGDVWQQHKDGSWSNQGPVKNITGSKNPTGQRGKDRESH